MSEIIIPTCHIVHGYNVADGGQGTTDKTKPYVKERGWNTREHDFGEFDLLDVREDTGDVVEKLLAKVKDGDAFLGHSHGCNIGSIAIDHGAQFSVVIFIHPALYRDWEPPAGFKGEIHVFYHWSDYATLSARLVRRYSPLNLYYGRHRWGAMGSFGPKSKHPAFVRHKGAWWHSSGFKDIEEWGPVWAECLPLLEHA